MNVNLGEKGYPIYIAPDFSGLGKACAGVRISKKVVIITDSNVEKIYCENCVNAISGQVSEVAKIVIPAGEKSKDIDTVRYIYHQLIEMKADRNTALAALGGGVVGDITGFAAATFMRGVPFIQLPTSLLAQADSSIGGKTGVDFEGNKNMIGAFYQPKFVYINVNTLKTLPVRELRSGLAEVIKHGLICDREFFDYLANNLNKIFSFDENTLQYITKMNCTIKGTVVEQDEKEDGLRAILNFGHTIGHAIESVSEFSMLHGECVSIGIAGAYRLAVKLGMASAETANNVESVFRQVGLPVRVHGLSREKIYEAMFHDKKIKEGKLHFILPKDIGEVVQCVIEDDKLIKEVLSEIVI